MKEKNKIYDIIIVWAGAAWLFSAINIPKKFSKLILEKNPNPWVKILLSWWERANVSNMDIEPERDYFWQNKKALKSVFARYNQWDIMSWFAENWINIVEEDRWRLILESWDSKELLNILVKKAKNNNSEIICKQDVKEIRKTYYNSIPLSGTFSLQEKENQKIFEIQTEDNKKYFAHNIVISTWWKSFFQVWTTGEWYNFAKTFWLNIIEPTRALWWLSTQENLSDISGISSDLKVELFDQPSPPAPLPNGRGELKNKIIYSEFWPLLFTHFGLSWPIIFNTWNALWEYLNKIKLNPEDFEKYIIQNIKIKITFWNLEKIPKRVIKHFKLDELEEKEIILKIQNFRSWKEAKATGWWIDLNELDKFMQSKKVENLFFIWEVCDITGKTGWFNLQWAWSSDFSCSEFFKK